MGEHAYIVGHPVAHSKSPAMHNAAYRALGWDWDYGFADCEDEEEARSFLVGRPWGACNVTMPYKPLALAIATRPSETAIVAGGANVLIRDEDGGILADNTDGAGCVSYLERGGVVFEGASVAICGTGPTAISIMHACACAGAASIALFSRDAARAARALDRYADDLVRATDPGAIGRCDDSALDGGRLACFEADRRYLVPAWSRPRGGAWRGNGDTVRYSAAAYGQATDVLGAADIIIDATSLGMREGDPAPFDASLLHSGCVVFDVVYGHGETALIRAARAAGCRAFDGEGMLVAQAVETIHDIVEAGVCGPVPADVDLFAIMAEAAGFAL